MWAMFALAAVKGVSSIFAGRAQAEQYAGQAAVSEYNAQLAEADARAADRATDFAQTQQALESASIMGSLAVEQGVSGARTDVGAPFMVRRQVRSQLEADRALIGMQGRARAAGLRSEAAIQRVQKKLFRKASGRAIISGFLGAAGAGLEAATLKSRYYPSRGAVNRPGIIEARDR
jgi:hypothetical protein